MNNRSINNEKEIKMNDKTCGSNNLNNCEVVSEATEEEKNRSYAVVNNSDNVPCLTEDTSITENNSNQVEITLLFVWGTYKLLVLTMSCLCAFLHRRHLMVWAVFAPKVSTDTLRTGPIFQIVLKVLSFTILTNYHNFLFSVF